MTNILIEKFTCVCGYAMNAASDPSGKAMPSENDVVLCLNCARINLFNKDLTLRQSTDTEIKELKGKNEWKLIQEYQQLIYKIIKNNLAKT